MSSVGKIDSQTDMPPFGSNFDTPAGEEIDLRGRPQKLDQTNCSSGAAVVIQTRSIGLDYYTRYSRNCV